MIVVTVARKPLPKGVTVAQNTLSHGTGGLNVDGTRIPIPDGEHINIPHSALHANHGAIPFRGAVSAEDAAASAQRTRDMGRWPANIILSDHLTLPDNAERYFRRLNASNNDPERDPRPDQDPQA